MPVQKKQEKVLRLFFAVPLFVLLPFIALSLHPMAATAMADTWYVKPSAEVPIRSGQGTEYKILSVVPDGLTVTILEDGDPWVKVRTEGGTEGWMLKRYLSKDPPLTGQVAALRAEKERLEQENKKMLKELEELSAAFSQNQQELNTCIAERDEIRQNYEALRTDTADVVTIKKNLTDRTREVEEIRQQLAVLERENRNLQKDSSLKWFLAGGLVLVTGWVLGLISSRARRRKSSLY